jgi:hypothetical protein
MKALFSTGLKFYHDRRSGRLLGWKLVCEIIFMYLVLFGLFFLFRLEFLIELGFY